MRYVKIVGALVLLVLMFACEDFKEEEYYPTEFDEGMFSFLDNDYAALRDTVVALSVIKVDSAFSDSLMDAIENNEGKDTVFQALLDSLNFLAPGYEKAMVVFDEGVSYNGYFVLDLSATSGEKQWTFLFDNYVTMTLWDPEKGEKLEVYANNMPLEVVVGSKSAKERFVYELSPREYICRLKRSEEMVKKGIGRVDMVALEEGFSTPTEMENICKLLKGEENVVGKVLYSTIEIDSGWTDMIGDYIDSTNQEYAENVAKIKDKLEEITADDFSKRVEFKMPTKVEQSVVVNDVGYVVLDLASSSDTIDVTIYIDDMVDVRVWELSSGKEIDAIGSGVDIRDVYACGVFQKKMFRLASGEYVLGYVPFEATEENVIASFGCLFK
ncbi:MAG: hypothetical protein H0Z30_10760 [Candidatus Marinimicrobia bacterium]|nr:hypothetical protein [Candidatus Neomarinimicrobiota bacterium]